MISSDKRWSRQELAGRAAQALDLRTVAAAERRWLDKYRLHGDPELLLQITAVLAESLPAEAGVLAGIELGGVPLATALSLYTGLPWCLVRRAGPAEHQRSRLSGPGVAGRTVVVIKDMAQSGAAIEDAAQSLREAEAVVTHVAVAINWNPGLTEVLAPIGITPISALSRVDFLPVKNTVEGRATN